MSQTKHNPIVPAKASGLSASKLQRPDKSGGSQKRPPPQNSSANPTAPTPGWAPSGEPWRAREPLALYQAVCRIAVEHGQVVMAWIGLPDPITQHLTAVTHAGKSQTND